MTQSRNDMKFPVGHFRSGAVVERFYSSGISTANSSRKNSHRAITYLRMQIYNVYMRGCARGQRSTFHNTLMELLKYLRCCCRLRRRRQPLCEIVPSLMHFFFTGMYSVLVIRRFTLLFNRINSKNILAKILLVIGCTLRNWFFEICNSRLFPLEEGKFSLLQSKIVNKYYKNK